MNTFAIDDDPVSRLALVDLLRHFDLGACAEFESADAAWSHLATHPPPMLVLCDVRMPGMSGVEFLKRLRERPDFTRVPFVLVTSATERETVQEAIRLGAAGYVVKPFSIEEAKGRLETVIHATWSDIAEDPSTTLRRLSISAPKLNTYYSAFRRQLDENMALLRENPGPMSDSVVLSKLDALHTGCLTLGLWHGARILDALKHTPQPSSCLKDFLTGVAEVLDQQRRGVRHGFWQKQDKAA